MGVSSQTYERRLQLRHFFDDRDTDAKRRTWLEIQLALPSKAPEGWVNDGKVRLSLGEDKDITAAFILNIDEACRLYKSLEILIQDHNTRKARLWRE
jgi:hypothetical protein